jgi:hypothetical protein
MPAPKMDLMFSTGVNQPAYGYTSTIHTGIQWDLIADNYKGIQLGTPYITSEFICQFDETMSSTINSYYGKNSDIKLHPTDSGFYPFSPLITPTYNAARNKNIYIVKLQNHSHGGQLKSPWLYSEHEFGFLWVDYYSVGMPVFENKTTPVEGDWTLRDGVLLGNGVSEEKMITNIREIDSPPELTIPENYVSVLTRSGVDYTLETKRWARRFAGITAGISIQCGYEKCAQILAFLLDMGTKAFYVNMPDYKLFGVHTDLQMKHYDHNFGFDAWYVKMISPEITINHDSLNRWSIDITLALVI